jgi:hypothetical protein
MKEKKVLVPYNFSQQDEKVIHYIIHNYAGDVNISVTLFHLYTPVPKIGSLSPSLHPSLSFMKEKMGSQIKELFDKEADFERLVQNLLENGFSPEHLNTVLRAKKDTIGTEIIQLVQKEDYNTVVMSKTPGKGLMSFKENVHAKLLSSLRDCIIIIIC